MKNALKILMVLILSNLVSSCTKTKLVLIHKKLVLEPSCPYTPLSKRQKDYLRKETGHTIAFLILKNKQDCESREQTNHDIVTKHNELHGKKNDS